LGPTHEEVITALVRGELRSYRQLPVNLYQIQNKYRDEIRPRFGLLRGREFVMKDGYSFHVNQSDLDREYAKMSAVYHDIFKRCGLETKMVRSDSGTMGGSLSHEFMLLTGAAEDAQQSGENDVLYCETCGYAANRDWLEEQAAEGEPVVSKGSPCPDCGVETGATLQQTRGIEVGNIFQLGSKYSASMKALFTDEDGQEKPFLMGCYGIGVSRLAAAAVERHHDEWGLQWPLAIAPFSVVVSVANMNDEAQSVLGERLYQQLQQAGVDVILDDRTERAGVKFKDADLMGFPYRITVGKHAVNGQVELKARTDAEVLMLEQAEVLAHIKAILSP
jgi:prolyl-tRNA synthetase